MKNYICLVVVVFVWCVMLTVFIRPSDERQAAAAPVIDELASVDKTDKATVVVSYMDSKSGTVKEAELEEYTARVLSGLMDETAPMEALKAVAVTIRSLVCYRAENRSHSGYILCDDPDHCFAVTEKASQSCIKAVKATAGQMLSYNGSAVLGISHQSSRVCTESYKTVYGTDLPYLKSTAVYDESGFVCYTTEKVLSASEFKAAFSDYSVTMENNHKEWTDTPEYTQGNRVYTVKIGGVRFKGATVANVLDLPSTDFSISPTENGFLVTAYGEGSGVGLSRCTAILMATEGKEYRYILEYFYKDTELSIIYSE